MRLLFACLSFALVLTLVSTNGVAGEKDKKEEKEVTLKGTICCAKCALNLTKACATVIEVEKDKKKIVYYFDAAAHKKHHADFCSDSKAGTVVGTVSEKDGKHTVTVKKLETK